MSKILRIQATLTPEEVDEADRQCAKEEGLTRSALIGRLIAASAPTKKDRAAITDSRSGRGRPEGS